MPRMFLTHSSLSINLVIWLNWFYLQTSLKPTFSSPLFRPSPFSFFNHKAYSFILSLLKTASKHHHSNFPQIQIWSRHCQFPAVHGAQTRRPHQATVTRPGPCSCTNRTQESLHSSPASPTVSLAHKILVMTQWLFFSNTLFDLV